MKEQMRESNLIEMVSHRIVQDALMPMVDRLISAPELPLEFQDRLEELIRQGYWPVLYANHQSHVDVFALAGVTSRLVKLVNEEKILKQQFCGFRLPVAASLQSGHQGDLLQSIYEKARSQVAAKGLFLVPVTREKDRNQYGLKKTNRDSLLYLARAREEGYGLAIFPEGNVQGGRRKGEGPENIWGLQMVEEDMWALAQHVRGAIFVPVAIQGGFKVFNPDTRRPTWEAVRSVLSPRAVKLITVKVGKPVSSDEVLEEVSKGGSREFSWEKEITNFLMRKVAELLPPHAQGTYSVAQGGLSTTDPII